MYAANDSVLQDVEEEAEPCETAYTAAVATTTGAENYYAEPAVDLGVVYSEESTELVPADDEDVTYTPVDTALLESYVAKVYVKVDDTTRPENTVAYAIVMTACPEAYSMNHENHKLPIQGLLIYLRQVSSSSNVLVMPLTHLRYKDVIFEKNSVYRLLFRIIQCKFAFHDGQMLILIVPSVWYSLLINFENLFHSTCNNHDQGMLLSIQMLPTVPTLMGQSTNA